MGIIHQLPEDIAIKIAAGEVVERPASVVKELVENALDAGATEIEVNLKDGGKTTIEVKDNGSGMDRDDAVKAFLRHGTSKIRQVEDLGHVTTLGFRGEALAAIGASAEVTLVTCLTNSSEGTVVMVSFGHYQDPKPHAPIPGTSILVNNLFESLPARQKFLKSDVTEWKACLDVLMKQMITHPDVAFSVTHNDRKVFNLSLNQTFAERVAALWQLDESKLIPVESESAHMTLKGVVVKPEVAHLGKARQFLSVNGHPVTDKMIARSIRDAFGTLLPPAMQPSYALTLTLHPGMVDVNIHPRKDEVRFINPQEIYRLVLHGISQSLEKINLSFTEMPSALRPMSVPTPTPAFAPRYSVPSTSWPKRHATFEPGPIKTLLEAATEIETPKPPQTIVTIGACFLVTEHEGQLLLVDQHAAHERILYHQLWEDDKAKTHARQPLLLPAPLALSEDQLTVLQEHRAAFEDLGFAFNPDLTEIIEVPTAISRKEPTQFLADLINGLDESRPEPELTDFKHKLFATMACKAAIKAGDVVSEGEKQQVLMDLLNLPDRYTCPHGRPAYILIATDELEKLFKRTGF